MLSEENVGSHYYTGYSENKKFIEIDIPLPYIRDEELAKILIDNECEILSSAIISCSLSNLEELSRFPWYTIHYMENESTEADGPVELSQNFPAEFGKLPDFTVKTATALEDIFTGKNVGFGAEAISYRFLNHKNGKAYATRINKIYRYHGNVFQFIAGGRYFNTHDPRAVSSFLSAAILKYKAKDIVEPIILSICKFLLNVAKDTEIDGITRIPPKIEDDRDRLGNIVKLLADLLDVNDYSSSLKSVKEIGKQKSLNAKDRYENVKESFECSDLFMGKTVVLIDDVITTGATIRSCLDELYGKGANFVIVIVLGINQYSISSLSNLFSLPNCPTCGSSNFKLKIRNSLDRYNKLGCFFGCSTRIKSSWCSGLLNLTEWNEELKNCTKHITETMIPDFDEDDL